MQINGFQIYPGCSNVPPMQIQRSRQMEGSGFYPEARICVQLCSCPATVVQLCSCPAKCCQNPALSLCYHVAMVLLRWEGWHCMMVQWHSEVPWLSQLPSTSLSARLAGRNQTFTARAPAAVVLQLINNGTRLWADGEGRDQESPGIH